MRTASLDTLRTVAVFAVICLHADPFLAVHMDAPTPLTNALAQLINALARFAVPAFFAVSGFLAGNAATSDPLARWARSAGRIMGVFVFWSLCYALLPQWEQLASGSIAEAVEARLREVARQAARAPLLFLMEGTERHLWFLPALALCSGLTALCARRGAWRVLLAMGGALYALGLAGQGYAPLLYDAGALHTRNGPFMGTLLYALGWLAARRPPLSLKTALLLAVGGETLQLIEAYSLGRWFHMPVANYYLGTLPLTVGLLDVARRLPHMGERWGPAWCGPYVLGIYAVHVLALRVTYKLHAALGAGVLWQAAFPVLAFALSLALALAGARIPLLRHAFR